MSQLYFRKNIHFLSSNFIAGEDDVESFLQLDIEELLVVLL